MKQPYVHIELDKPRKLRFRHNDLADMEVASGGGLDNLLSTQTFHGARLLLSFGLRWQESHGMSAKTAGDLIQDHWISKGKSLKQLADVIMEALKASGVLPDDAKETEGNAQPNETTADEDRSATT